MGIICRFDIVWKLRDQRKLVLFFTLNYVLTGDAFRDIYISGRTKWYYQLVRPLNEVKE